MKGVANIATTWVVFLGLLTGPWPGEVAGQANDSACVDSSLDRNGNPLDRARYARGLRWEWAQTEFQASRDTCQDGSNDDWSSAARFHKTLPHDGLGQVVPGAFAGLLACAYEGNFDTCEAIPQGDPSGFLVNPLGGLSVDMAGPSSTAVSCPALPALNSSELAAQLAEVYWMSLVRDVPFSKYGEHNDTIAAAVNLATMPGFAEMNGVVIGANGSVDPLRQLFRSAFIGVETGPMISQLLLSDFTMDSLDVTPKQTTFAPGVDYMTDYDTWLHIQYVPPIYYTQRLSQNGGAPESPEELDSQKRYIRTARDLARLVATDTIYTEAFRAALVLMDQGAFSRGGANGPYANSTRQAGFLNFGASHLMKTFASFELAQKASWYQKWNVHLFARPEAVAGTLHNVMNGLLDVEFHASLVDNEELLGKVAAHNAAQNLMRIGTANATYLPSQVTAVGSPAHPSYPAGHAVQNGAYATVLKAFVGLERGGNCFSNPVYSDDEGLELLAWDGECLTYEGEINKLAVNVAYGRQMMGVHYRFDSHEGLILGETFAIRRLHQELVGFSEDHYYEFRLFTGETIKLDHDGAFYIDGHRCSGAGFTGVDDC